MHIYGSGSLELQIVEVREYKEVSDVGILERLGTSTMLYCSCCYLTEVGLTAITCSLEAPYLLFLQTRHGWHPRQMAPSKQQGSSS